MSEESDIASARRRRDEDSVFVMDRKIEAVEQTWTQAQQLTHLS